MGRRCSCSKISAAVAFDVKILDVLSFADMSVICSL
jgi:hypothetical protein